MQKGSIERGGVALLTALCLTLTVSALGQAQERGWLGISMACSNCSSKTDGEVVIWSFSSPPKVEAVRAGSPAAKAGMRAGDEILAIAGVDITSSEGGLRFGSLRSGVATDFRVRRGERELTITVTPAGEEEAFGEWRAFVAPAIDWDSLRLQMRQIYEGQLRLRSALRNAERALERTEAEGQRTNEERELARNLRLQIDSIHRELDKSHKRLRVEADSLAARTLYVTPRAAPRVELVVPAVPEARTVTLFSDAVAGARFEELNEDSPWLSYLPGVSEGLLIIKVVENTPAYVAGLREGDVVTEVNGESVRTVADLRGLWPGAGEAELTYVRKGKKQTCTIPSR